jgi:hypothetical protein
LARVSTLGPSLVIEFLILVALIHEIFATSRHGCGVNRPNKEIVFALNAKRRDEVPLVVFRTATGKYRHEKCANQEADDSICES